MYYMNKSIWDHEWKAPDWAQSKIRLARHETALEIITEMLLAEKQLRGSLSKLTPRVELSENTLFFAANWSNSSEEVFIKIGCTDMDLYWAQIYEKNTNFLRFTPKIYASGKSLGGEEINWFVMEEIPFKVNKLSLAIDWNIIAKTVAEYQKDASLILSPNAYPIDFKAINQFLKWGLEANAPEKSIVLFERLEKDWNWIEKSCPSTVQFGDLHLGNIYSRKEKPEFGDIVLLDPIPRKGLWIFDPAYCQVIATSEDIKLIEKVRKYRLESSLEVGRHEDFDKMSKLMLGWLSIMWFGLSPKRREEKEWVTQITKYITDAVEV